MNKKLTQAILAGMVWVAALAASGGLLTQNWRIDAPTAPVPNDNTSRGMAYNPSTGHLLVAQTTPAITVLNAADGTNLGSVNVTGVSGGTLALVKIRVVDFGAAGYAIYGCNLVTDTRTASFKIYRWFGTPGQNETTLGQPEVIYINRAADAATTETSPVGPTLPQAFIPYAQRIGDTFWATAQGAGQVSFYVGVARSTILNSVYKFDYTDPQVPPASSTAVSAVSEITLKGLPSQYGFGNALRGEYVDASGNIWHQTNGALAVYNSAGNFQSMISGVNYGSLHGVPLAIGGKTYFCAIHHGVPAASTAAYARFSVTDVSTGPGQGQLIDFGPNLATPNHNGNGAGDFATDGTNIFALVTNNYVGSFSITPPSAGVTKKWNGGASGSWFNSANWSPAGVPGPLDDVVLDHSLVSGAYTVSIDAAQEASCRTLTVGDPLVASDQIILRFTSAATGNELLNIGGDNNPATPDVNIRAGGRFEFTPGALSGATSFYYFDPTATCLVDNGGYLYLATSRSIATPFPGALPAGYVPVSYGAWSFADGSTVEFNGTGTAIPFSGRTFGNLILTGTVNYSASGSLPVRITGTLSIGPTATFKPSMSNSVTLEGSVTNLNSAVSQFNAAPLVIANSMTWPANVDITGDLVIPAGVTLTVNNALTLGGANTGKIAHVFGTLTCNNTLTIQGTIAPRSGGVIDGLGSVTWVSNAGIATDNPAGFANMPPIAADFPGVSISGFFSNIPTVASGVWGFCGDVTGQAAGALPPGDVGGLIIDTTGTVALGGDYRCLNVLGLKKGIVSMNGGAGTLTLGSSGSNGTLTYPSANFALIQGTFKRWRTTMALSGIDFPLADSQGRRRMLTLSSSVAPSAGGTIAVRFSESDPGGGPIDIIPSTAVNALDKLTKVDPTGSYLITLGDGITVSGSSNWTAVADIAGFTSDLLSQQIALIKRDPATPTSWAAFDSVGAPTYLSHLGVQSLSNPEHPSFGPFRLQAVASTANLFYSNQAEIGVGLPTAWAGVSEWMRY